ncbi:MAG: alpha/beta fold hydrolase, partial [Actinomycetales bacterium]
MPRRLVLVSTVLAILVLATLVVLLRDDSDPVVLPGPTGERAPKGLASFYHQEPRWTSCGAYRCTRVRVPLDYARPQGATVRLSVRMLRAGDGDTDRLLFVNPGGPGGSAVEYVAVFAELMSPAMRRGLSLVGVDPRGVGTSQALECVDADRLDAYLDHDATPDDPREESVLTDSSRKLADACARESGAISGHMSTQESARDLDVVRAVLGQRRLDYYGASYGTQLGATYADRFPEHAGRLVL